MRNLKRALSLGLTAAMISGLMVTGASALSYNDSDEIQNQTAVEILGEIGAMVGDDKGNFNPDQDVTRAEMAVIITRILYGNNLNVDQFKGMNIFSDVPSWAEGFVNLCASLDIVAGVGGDKFDPNATVTTAQASLMLSRALGYFQNTAEFGNDWALSAVRRATQVGIIGGDMVLQANEGLSRDDVAQMTFNTLTKAVPVQYNELLDVYYNENKGITYSLTFYYTDTLGYQNFDLVYRSNDRGDYGRPSTTWGTGSYRSSSATSVGNDDYGLNEDGSLKPELVNMLEEDEIITVAEEPTYVYTEATKNSDVYKDLGRSLVEDDEWTWEAYVDGTEQRDPVLPTNTSGTYQYTTDGATTEVYVDDVNKEITVVQINYYMGEVTDIDEDENGEYATVRVLSKKTDKLSDVVDERDIYCTGFAEDDYVMVTVDVNDDNDSFIASIAYPETAEGTVTRVKMDSEPEDEQGNYVKLEDDTKHEYSAWTASDLDDINENHPTLDAQYRLYLDPNGFVIGFIAMENVYDNYLYIEEADSYLGNIEAKVTFADGSSEVVTIDDEWVDGNKIIGHGVANANNIKNQYDAANPGLAGRAYGYSVSGDVYTLRQLAPIGTTEANRNTIGNAYNATMFRNYKDVARDVEQAYYAGIDATINNGVAYITVGGTRYIIDSNTQFVDVAEGVVYEGYENVPDYISTETENVGFWAVDTRQDNGVLDVVFIYSGESSNDNKTYFYVTDNTEYETFDRDGMYKEQEVFIDGQRTTLIFTQAAFNDVNEEGLYVVERTNGNGDVTNVTFLGGDIVGNMFNRYGDGAVLNFRAPKYVGANSFGLGDTDALQWVTNSDTIFVNVIYDLNSAETAYEEARVRVGDLKDMDKDDDYNTYVYVAKPNSSNDPAELVFIVDVEKMAGHGGGVVVEGDFPVITYNRTTREYEVRYYGNKTAAQERDYVINAIEEYTGIAVRQYNPLTGELWLENSWIPVDVKPIQVYAVTADNMVQYFDEGETDITGLTAGKNYLYSTTAAALSPDKTANSFGTVYVTALSADIALVDAYQVSAGSGVTDLKVGSVNNASNLWVPYSSSVEVTGTTSLASDCYATFVDNATGKSLVDATYEEAGDTHVKTVTITGTVTINEKVGYQVKAPNGAVLGVYGSSDTVVIPGNGVSGLKFVVNNGASPVSTTENASGYRVNLSGLTPVKGEFVFTQVAEITTDANVTVDYRNLAGAAATLPASSTDQIVRVGQTLTVKATVSAGDTIQVSYDGGTTWTNLGADGEDEVEFNLTALRGQVDFKVAAKI